MKFTGTVPKLEDHQLTPAVKDMKFKNGHWLFDEPMGRGVGFIYVIRDNYLHRCYLGQKHYRSDGKLTKGLESDWKRYKSSSKVLAEHFKERPMYEFDFICIEQYNTPGTLSYAETWSLCLVEAPTTNFWYNRLVPKVSWPVAEPISARHKDRLARTLAWEDFDG
jgi:hypothetical protein